MEEQNQGVNIKEVMMGLKQARRAVRMRDSEPEQVAEIIQRAMQQAIILQKSGDDKLAKLSAKELRQIRKDLIAGQVDAGAETEIIVGKISGLLDTIDEVDQQIKKENRKAVQSALDGIKDNIPSSDTIISAIMTANPILGYAFKMFGDLSRSIKNRREQIAEAKREEAEERARRLDMYDENGNLIERQTETDEMVRESLFLDDDPYIPYLERIEDNLARFNEAFGVQAGTLERIAENTEDTGPSVEEQYEQQNQTESKSEETNIKSKTKKPGIIGTLLGGLITGVTGIFSTLWAVFKPIMKLAGRLFIITTVIKAVYDLVDGFFNASKIIDNFDGSIGDRIMAGISSMAAGLITAVTDLFDWVVGLFGFEGFNLDKEVLANKIFDVMNAVVDWISEKVTAVGQWFASIPDKVTSFIDRIVIGFESALDRLTNLPSVLGDKISSFFDWIGTEITNVVSPLVERFKSTFGKIGDMIKSIIEFIQNKIGRVLKFLGIDFGSEETDKDTSNKSNDVQLKNGKLTRSDTKPEGIGADGFPVSFTKEQKETFLEKFNTNYVDYMSRGSQAIDMIDRIDTSNRIESIINSNKANTVIAPSNSNQMNVSSTVFHGSRSSENKDPTHRRVQRGSLGYAF